MPTKQARNCRVTDIVCEGEVRTLRTTDLAGENPRFDTYNALNPVKVWGTQEALF